MYFLHIIHSIHVIVCCLRFWQSIDSEGRKKWGSRFDHLNIPQYPSLHPFLCVCVFASTYPGVCFVASIRNMWQELDPYLWIFSGSEVSNEVSLRYVLLEDADHERWWFETPETMGFWDETSFCYPYPWEYDSHLTDVFQMAWKHQLEQVMEVFCSILYWIPKKFHNNHLLEQINSFQKCQPSGVFFICNFRASGIYLLRPHFSGCVVPFEKGDIFRHPQLLWINPGNHEMFRPKVRWGVLHQPWMFLKFLRDQSLKKNLKFVI